MFRHAQPLQQILAFARQSGATQVAITGYRAASLLSNGQEMTERADGGRQRAEQVADLLKGAGLTDVHYNVTWKDEARRANGKTDAGLRRAQIVVSSIQR